MSLHGEKLRTDLRVINTGDAPFEFTAALHSYFEVLDISEARVSGLAGLTYLDKVRAPAASTALYPKSRLYTLNHGRQNMISVPSAAPI